MDEVSTEQILSEMSAEKTGGTDPSGKTAQPAGAQPPTTGPDLSAEYEYPIEGGKTVKEKMEMILKRAGMGYHYAQKMHALSQKEQEALKFKEENGTLQQRIKDLSRWEEYDKYAKENQAWAQHVQESWQNRQNLGQSEKLNPEISSLQQQLAELKATHGELQKFMQDTIQGNLKNQQVSEDKSFAEEIEATEKKFGVDFSQADEKGRSLQWRVLEHMQEMGLDGSKKGHFTMAFKDFYFDQLTARQKEQFAEKTVKDQADLKRAGVKSISTKPNGHDRGYKPGMDWNDLSRLALEDYQAKR